MKTKIILIGLVVLGLLFIFGCTQTPTTNYTPENENELIEEIDSSWVDNEDLNIEEAISSEENIESETDNSIIDENENLSIGEMF